MINICCCLRLKSKQISELCQKRGFNSSTGVIGYADSGYSETSEIRTVPSEQCPDVRIIRISEFNLVSHAKSGKRIIMGPYMLAGSIPYRAAIRTCLLEFKYVFLLTLGDISR